MRTTSATRRGSRGIGNVLATIVFIFLIIFMTGNLMIWSILRFSDYQTVAQEMSEMDSFRLSERIDISSASITSARRLNVTVTNTGGATSHIVGLWVINETAVPDKHFNYPQDIFIPRGASVSGIGFSIQLNTDKQYTVKVVTELGNMASYQLIPVGQARLGLSMTVDPPTVISEWDVSVSLSIFNNLPSRNSVYGIQVPTNLTASVSGGQATVTLLSSPSPSYVDALASGSTATFTWKYTVTGDIGANITFTGWYLNGPPGYNASSSTLIVTGFGRGVEGSLQSILGSLVIDFESIQWARRSPQTQVQGFTWVANWEVDKSYYLVFRLNVTNRGENTFTVDNQTALYFQRLDPSPKLIQLYIVNGNNTENRIWQYSNSSPISIAKDQTKTLYFAVKDNAGNPTSSGQSERLGDDGTYLAILGLFGISPRYGQAVPFEAFIAY